MDYNITTPNGDIDLTIEVQPPTAPIVDQLIQCRKAAGLTQQEISDMTGMARANIARVESKRTSTSLDVLMRYASCLGYDVVLSLKKRNSGS